MGLTKSRSLSWQYAQSVSSSHRVESGNSSCSDRLHHYAGGREEESTTAQKLKLSSL